MAVNTPNISINPYTSTVPTVQVPPPDFAQQAPAQPLQGRFTGTGTGKLAIGDSILKGFLAGHAYKEQKKAAQAQATIAAADAATDAAYQKYQTALAAASGRVEDPNAQAAYQAYTETFGKSKEAKAKFVIPDEPKKTTGKGAKEKMKGAIHNVKDWMEANPHVIPQLALLSMQPQPPGQSPEGKKQQFETQREEQILAEGKAEAAETARKLAAQKTVDRYSGLSSEELARLPQSEQESYRSAQNVLTPRTNVGATKLYTLPDGSKGWFHPDNVPEGAQPVEPASATGGKVGTFGDYVSRWARENGVDQSKVTAEQLDALKKRWSWDSTHDSSASTKVTPGIDSTTTSTSRTAGGPPPLPSVGGATGPITRPPASSHRASARGGITAPPGSSTNPSPTRARMTAQAAEQKETRISQARQKLNDVQTRNLRIADPTLRKQADDMANKTFEDEMKSAEHAYDQATRAVGGTPGSAGSKKPAASSGAPKGATVAYKDKDGNIKGYAVNGQFVPVGQ